MVLRFAAIGLLVAAAVPVGARASSAEAVGQATVSLQNGSRPLAWRRCAAGDPIDDLRLERVPVFDPADPDNEGWPWRLANVVHSPMQTRPGTILALLTVTVGEPCSIESLEEAERVLRGYDFIQDAWVLPAIDEDGELVLDVRVQDAWSTRLGISFSREGGESRSRIQILEQNLFGTGSRLEWERDEDQDRTERAFVFADPALFGSRWRLRLERSDNSDGLERSARIDRPFRELSDRWSLLAELDELARERKVYDDGLEIDRWQVDGLEAALRYGGSPRGLVDDRLFRWNAGLRVDRQRWTLAPSNRSATRPDLRPADRDLVLAELGGSWRRIDFRRERHLDTARRVQDLDVGREIWCRIGVAAPGWSNDSGGRLAMGYRAGFELRRDGFLLLSASHELERLRDRWLNGVTSFSGRYYRRFPGAHTLYVGLRADYGTNLEGPRRFLLGGDTGLRGYPSRAFSGERQLLAVVEHRYFADWDVWSLFRIGFATFFEVGGAWDDEDSFGLDTLHPDVGFGLRALILPSANDTTAHVNVAFPLDAAAGEEPGVPRFSFTTVAGF